MRSRNSAARSNSSARAASIISSSSSRMYWMVTYLVSLARMASWAAAREATSASMPSRIAFLMVCGSMPCRVL